MYNYFEAFQDQPEKPDDSISIDSTEVILIKQRLSLLKQKFQEYVETEDIEVITYVKFLLHKDFLLSQQDVADTLMENLSEEADRLINSPEANTPEVLKKRKEIADQINELIEISEELKQGFEEQEAIHEENKLLSEATKNRGHAIATILRKEIEKISIPSEVDLN